MITLFSHIPDLQQRSLLSTCCCSYTQITESDLLVNLQWHCKNKMLLGVKKESRHKYCICKDIPFPLTTL